MSLLDQLQAMYGQPSPNDQLQQMLAPVPSMQLQQPSLMTQSEQQAPPQRELSDLDIMEMFTGMVNDNAKQRDPSGGGAPAGMHASSVTQKTEQGGVPPMVEAQGVAARGQEEVGNAQVDANRLRTQGESAGQEAQQQLAQVAAEKAANAEKEAENDAKQQRLRSQQMDLAKQNDEPINPNRYIQNRDMFSKGSAIISAAIYGFLNPHAQGAAPVVENLMKMAQEDTQAQIATNAGNRAQRGALMEQYERQYGDTTLVAKRLEADKLLTFAKEAKAQGMAARSVEAKAQADDLVSKLQNRVGVIHNDIQKAMYGKPVETSTTYSANKVADPGAKLDRSLKTVESLQKLGYTTDEIAGFLKTAGLPAPGGKSEFQLKNEKDAADAKRDDTKLEMEREKAKSLTPEMRQKMLEKVDGLAMARQGFEELDATAGIKRDTNGEVTGDADKLEKAIPGAIPRLVEAVGGAIPMKIGDKLVENAHDSQPEDTKALRRATSKIGLGMAHAESGAGVNEGEMRIYTDRMSLSGSDTFKRATAEVFREQRQKYRNMVGAYGKENVDEMLRKRGIDPSVYGDL